MDEVNASVKWQSAIVYITDCIVFSKLAQKHVQDIDEVLRMLKEGGVTRKLEKCLHFSESTEYRNHVFVSGKVKVAKTTTKAIEPLRQPEGASQVRFF